MTHVQVNRAVHGPPAVQVAMYSLKQLKLDS
jgi:hypothetical protein